MWPQGNGYYPSGYWPDGFWPGLPDYDNLPGLIALTARARSFALTVASRVFDLHVR